MKQLLFDWKAFKNFNAYRFLKEKEYLTKRRAYYKQ